MLKDSPLRRGPLPKPPKKGALNQNHSKKQKMKKLDPNLINMQQKAIGVVHNSHGTLYYFEEGFAYLPKGMTRPTFAFESEFCENLLDSIKRELLDVQILTIVREEMSEEIETDFEIRFVLRTGVIFMVTSGNDAYRMHPLVDEPNEDPKLSIASDVWGIAHDPPYDQMIISDDAIDRICENFGEMEPSRALRHLWSDIQSAIENSPYHDVHIELSVESSTGFFSIVEHLCGRVAIYLPGEVPQRFRVFE
ncbi:hypothetical protein DDZ13_09550 [Coraliomargarita sinensis]|uniref:Uncharacterized protein n=2 Tax=Coraliomargarita sinensis TaxID=2174842 RepID=A0A317ZEK6_9BACT|nr:hypothetical protein DDZ13_09550 [Coraliomargarita sinensis]